MPSSEVRRDKEGVRSVLDVSLRSVSIYIIDHEGTIQFESKVSSDVDKIVTCLKHFSPDVTSVGFEAGTLTQHITYGLQAAGYEVICLPQRAAERNAEVTSPSLTFCSTVSAIIIDTASKVASIGYRRDDQKPFSGNMILESGVSVGSPWRRYDRTEGTKVSSALSRHSPVSL